MNEAPSGSDRKRYLSLDIVRGLAAFSVFATHWSGWTATVPSSATTADTLIDGARDLLLSIFWSGGGIHPGVVVFIVLSGFCIHMPVAMRPEIERADGFLSRYAVRRFFRVVPLYWFASLLGIAAILIANGRVPFFQDRVVVWAALVTFAGVSGIAKLFFPSVEFHSGNVPLSTVASEIVLYVIYPLLLWTRRRSLLLIAGFAGFGYFLYVALVWSGFPSAAVESTFLPFLLYWVMGAAAVELFARYRSNVHLRISVGITLLTLFLYLAFSYLVHFRGAHFFTTPILALHAAALLHTMMTAESRLRRSGLVARALGALGQRSYSLYAVHTPVIALATAGFLSTDLRSLIGFRIAVVVAVAAVTEAVYRLVEAPSHRLAARLASAASRSNRQQPEAVALSA